MNPAPLRILQLIPRSIFPPDDGGKIGIYNITREFLDAGFAVHLVIIAKNEDEIAGLIPKDWNCECTLLLHSTANTPLRIAQSLFSTEPIYLAKHQSNVMLQTLIGIATSFQPDILHADHTAMLPLATELASLIQKPVGVRLHNVEWRIWQRYADEIPFWHSKKWYIQRQARLLKNREAQLLHTVDVAFPITDVDKEVALKMSPNTHYVVAGAGVHPEEWTSVNSARSSHSMVLATVWSWVHNLNGGLWFIKEVMPIILKSIPTASLTLLGKNAPTELSQYGYLNVESKGYVESVKPYYHSASLYIAPLFVGSGVRIKILEAMAAGLPVVATSVSAEGIGASEEDGLFVSDDAIAQAEKIIYLMKNPDIAQSLGRAANEYVRKYHTWKQEVGKIIDEYKKMLNPLRGYV